MPAFFEYLRNITYYLMFATVAGMFAPQGKYKKFVSLVLGFILLLVMLRPLVTAFGDGEIPVAAWFGGIVPVSETGDWETSYSQWRDRYLREIFEAQLEAQLRGLLHGFTVYDVLFEYSPDFSRVTQVTVDVSRNESSGRTPLIRIQSPSFRGAEEDESTCPVAEEVKNLISQFYNLPSAHIFVNVTKERET